MPEVSTPSIDELFEAVLEGLERVFYNNPHSHASLCGVAYRVVRDYETAADIVAEVAAGCYAKTVEYFNSGDDQKLVKASADFGEWRFAATSVRRRAIDYVRLRDNRVASTDDLATADTAETRGYDGLIPEYRDPAEIVTRESDADGIRPGIATLITALGKRSTSRESSTLALAAEQMEQLAFFYRFDLLPELVELENANPKDPGPRDRSKEATRRREAKTGGEPGFDPNHRMNRRLANHLGKTPTQISRAIQKIRTTVGIAVYLTGILGRHDAFASTDAVDEHLDIFDHWLGERERQPDVKQIRLASTSMRTDEVRGTRVSGTVFARHTAAAQNDDANTTTPVDSGDPDTVEALASLLHQVETAYAAAAISRYPRCVLVCDRHTP